MRYGGVLAPHSAVRAEVVPGREYEFTEELDESGKPTRKRKRYTWAKLLARVFKLDLESCAACGGKLRIIAAITSREAMTKILDHLGLPSDPPSIAPARGPPQESLDFDS